MSRTWAFTISSTRVLHLSCFSVHPFLPEGHWRRSGVKDLVAGSIVAILEVVGGGVDHSDGGSGLVVIVLLSIVKLIVVLDELGLLVVSAPWGM